MRGAIEASQAKEDARKVDRGNFQDLKNWRSQSSPTAKEVNQTDGSHGRCNGQIECFEMEARESATRDLGVHIERSDQHDRASPGEIILDFVGGDMAHKRGLEGGNIESSDQPRL